MIDRTKLAIKRVALVQGYVPGKFDVLKVNTADGGKLYAPLLAEGRPSKQVFTRKGDALQFRLRFIMRMAEQRKAQEELHALRFWKLRVWIWKKMLMWSARRKIGGSG